MDEEKEGRREISCSEDVWALRNGKDDERGVCTRTKVPDKQTTNIKTFHKPTTYKNTRPLSIHFPTVPSFRPTSPSHITHERSKENV